MSSNLVIPFDEKPVSHQKGTGTYTCPAGKYAKVTITLNVTAYAYFSAFATMGINTHTATLSNGSDTAVLDVRVASGDTITFSSTAASATDSTSTVGTGTASTFAESTITANHNASAICRVRAPASGAFIGSQNSGTTTITISGTVSAYWFAQEYNEIT